MRITLKQLRVFAAVYRVSSTTLAAEQLSLSQSAVSTALQELEKLLNCYLFERSGKKLIANETARELYPKALAILAQVDEVENLFKGDMARLSIGASSTIGNYLLPPLISAFSRQYQNIEIVLHVYNTKEICEGVRNFEYDLGFIEGRNLFDELICEPWYQDELTLFVAKYSRLIPQDVTTIDFNQLSTLPLVLREKGSGTRELIEQLILNQMPASHILQLSHSEAIKQAVAYDFGIGCLSKLVLSDPLQLGKIRYLKLEDINLQRTLWMLQHKNKHISTALATFMQFCRENVH